ncbi:unnamed protein product [Soboliphyme baturini]|uniref:PLAT domain-containing protein n=1 Tax=Soboliphyme baturini TaxID=241478 RepID=A0A183IMQ2_9BILA|nr:unnamed protein product [Soboliphyme baturini]
MHVSQGDIIRPDPPNGSLHIVMLSTGIGKGLLSLTIRPPVISDGGSDAGIHGHVTAARKNAGVSKSRRPQVTVQVYADEGPKSPGWYTVFSGDDRKQTGWPVAADYGDVDDQYCERQKLPRK